MKPLPCLLSYLHYLLIGCAGIDEACGILSLVVVGWLWKEGWVYAKHFFRVPIIYIKKVAWRAVVLGKVMNGICTAFAQHFEG